jgi:sulfide dehydrogenase cytochrome subunit
MIRVNFRAISTALSGVLCVLATSSALAADGASVYDQCVSCHGKNGQSTEPAIPIIGGYSEKYITESFKNFRTKTRPCAEVSIPSGPKKGTKSDMCKVVTQLKDDDAGAVARWVAAQKFVRAKQPVDAVLAQKGIAVYKLRCEKCHENNGSSADEDNGILAGQWTQYLRDQLVAFRAGRRPSDDKMKQRLDKVSKEEEEQLLHFFAIQQ